MLLTLDSVAETKRHLSQPAEWKGSCGPEGVFQDFDVTYKVCVDCDALRKEGVDLTARTLRKLYPLGVNFGLVGGPSELEKRAVDKLDRQGIMAGLSGGLEQLKLQ
jgi:hypothetical protein